MNKNKANRFLATIFLLLPSYAGAASFNCTDSKSFLENLICSDTELSSLDSEVADNYKNLKSSSGNKNDVLEEQRRFLKQRTIMCPIPDKGYTSDYNSNQEISCLKYVYRLRINDLKSQIATLEESKITKQAKQEANNLPAIAPQTQELAIVKNNEPENISEQSAPITAASIVQDTPLPNNSNAVDKTEDIAASQSKMEEPKIAENLPVKNDSGATKELPQIQPNNEDKTPVTENNKSDSNLKIISIIFLISVVVFCKKYFPFLKKNKFNFNSLKEKIIFEISNHRVLYFFFFLFVILPILAQQNLGNADKTSIYILFVILLLVRFYQHSKFKNFIKNNKIICVFLVIITITLIGKEKDQPTVNKQYDYNKELNVKNYSAEEKQKLSTIKTLPRKNSADLLSGVWTNDINNCSKENHDGDVFIVFNKDYKALLILRSGTEGSVPSYGTVDRIQSIETKGNFVTISGNYSECKIENYFGKPECKIKNYTEKFMFNNDNEMFVVKNKYIDKSSWELAQKDGKYTDLENNEFAVSKSYLCSDSPSDIEKYLKLAELYKRQFNEYQNNLVAKAEKEQADTFAENTKSVQGTTGYVVCNTYSNVIKSAISNKKFGLTLSQAEDLADSAMRVDRRLYTAVISSIREAYKDDGSELATIIGINNGTWTAHCAKYVNTGTVN